MVFLFLSVCNLQIAAVSHGWPSYPRLPTPTAKRLHGQVLVRFAATDAMQQLVPKMNKHLQLQGCTTIHFINILNKIHKSIQKS